MYLRFFVGECATAMLNDVIANAVHKAAFRPYCVSCVRRAVRFSPVK